ncbi:hypothetical protein [Paraburkholderia youngii]|uniref:Uncharacterized protein n=1 Tax=Paraburkholderia youngii TaxID=2782701 RepID=A0A7W8P4X5_9BURK|nr:hypothetical protein [Paraburkholderia youngii]MBB5400292.1 hypothetical protein [Paraburkholderia youngii]
MSKEEKERQARALSDWEKPHLRLFFSADIVGSTAFKQKPQVAKKGGEQDGRFPLWFNTVLAFYHQAEQAFSHNWVSFERSCAGDNSVLHWFGPPPELWKTVGDEVLFTKQIEHPAQATVCCHAWIRTLDDLRQQLKERGLDVKSSAWLADFPLRNQEVVLRGTLDSQTLERADDEYPFNNQLSLEAYYADKTGNVIRDYIGPSIDTGFRLGGLASDRKFVVSLELAHVLSVEQAKSDKNTRLYSFGALSLRKFDFRYEGRVPLKGVLGGGPYPVIWIDLDPENEVHQAEDEVLGTPKPSAAQMRQLTGSFIAAHDNYLCSPYFFRDGEKIDGYEEIDEAHLDELLARHDRFEQTKVKRANEADLSEDVPAGEIDFDVNVDVPTLTAVSTGATSAAAGFQDGATTSATDSD